MLEVSHKRIALRAAHSRAALIIYGGGFIPDIKEKQPLKKVAKEKPTAVPRELIKQQTIRAAAWTKNQLQDAARGGEKEEAQQESVPNLTQVIPTVRHSAKPTASDRNNAPKTRDVVQEREQGFVETSASSNRASPPKEQPAPAAQTVSTQPPTAGNSPAGASSTEVFVPGVENPIQGSYEHSVQQGRQAARNKQVQKQAVISENRHHSSTTPTENTSLPRAKARRERFSEKSIERGVPTGTQHRPALVETAQTPFKERQKTVKAKSAQTRTVPATRGDYRQTNANSARSVQSVKQRRTAVKEAEKPLRTAEASQRTVQTAKSSQAAQAAAKAGKQAAESGKKAAKELSQKALRAIIAAGRSLASALGAGGAIALLVIVVVMLVDILLVSPFGIFFSGGTDGEMTLQQAMGILNTEFNDRITEIENSVAHDDIRQDGQQSPWREVLAIYAVKVTTDRENPQEVVAMDEEHLELLRQIFWDMNQIDYTTETYTEEVTVEVPAEDSTDEDGGTEEVQTVERTRLVITITSKTALQMAEEYGFDQEQLNLLTELLSEEYANLWFGVPGGCDDIVAVALSQVGNVGGQPYWSWYGFSSRVAWCACFVSWCADQCGYIEAGTFTKFSYCDAGIAWFKSRGQWQTRGYCPSPGDIIFFDWNNNGVSDHVGIVESCDGYYVYTVEGNANNAVQQLRYSINYSGIEGYGTPNYG